MAKPFSGLAFVLGFLKFVLVLYLQKILEGAHHLSDAHNVNVASVALEVDRAGGSNHSCN